MTDNAISYLRASYEQQIETPSTYMTAAKQDVGRVLAIAEALTAEVEYEYAIQRAWVGNGVWQEILADEWEGSLEAANNNLRHALKLDAHYGELGENKYYDYRIVKRLAPGEIEAV